MEQLRLFPIETSPAHPGIDTAAIASSGRGEQARKEEARRLATYNELRGGDPAADQGHRPELREQTPLSTEPESDWKLTARDREIGRVGLARTRATLDEVTKK